MPPLDDIYYWSILLVPFFIGILSGGQTIYAKMGNDFGGVLKSVWGWVYWLSRGIIPTGAYLLWFFHQPKPEHSWTVAVTCGLGAEAILRAKLYVTTKTEHGKPEDIFRGVFDLIDWWQALCLRQAGIARADARQKFVTAQVGNVEDFLMLCQKFQNNAGSFPQSVQTEIEQKITATRSAFEGQLANTTPAGQQLLHKTYILKMSYALLDILGKKGFRTLNS